MQTGTRWGGKANPRDLTKTRQQELLRQKQARDEAANVDVADVQRQAREVGFSDGWDAAIGWVIKRMTGIGLDPDILVVADDDAPAGDDAGGE